MPEGKEHCGRMDVYKNYRGRNGNISASDLNFGAFENIRIYFQFGTVSVDCHTVKLKAKTSSCLIVNGSRRVD